MEELDKKFPNLLYTISEYLTSLCLPAELVDRMNKMITYNLAGGKKLRGLIVLKTYEVLNPMATKEQLENAIILGWCVEWLQAVFLVADDIMDQSYTRRGKSCWYRNESVGMMAINDSFLLKSCIYKLLHQYFSKAEFYSQLGDAFHEVSFKTELGQSLDLLTTPTDQNRENLLETFTLEKYRMIVRYKTAYYSFYLPVNLALILSRKSFSNDTSADIERILLELGEYFQVQDDFLDCFGNPEMTGKIGTDIQDHKCSWLIVNALLLAHPKQKEILRANYGMKDQHFVQIIKDIYMELGLPKLYEDYCKVAENNIKELIAQIEIKNKEIDPKIFYNICKVVFNRKY